MRSCLSVAVFAVSIALAPGWSTQPELDVELHIQQPDGKPAAGAAVVFFGAGQTVIVRDAKFEYAPNVEPVTADGDGVVKLSPPKDQHRLVVAHDAGFALLSAREFEAQADGVIKLRPYGRIEGRLMIGENPASEGAMVTFRHYPPDQQLMQNLGVDNHATTDAEGRFTLEHVWPGDGLLTHLKLIEQGGVGMQTDLISVPTTVRASETTRAQIGGSGRPVVGKILLPQRASSWMVMAHLVPQRKAPEPPWPDEAAGWTAQQKNEFRGKWFASEEGRAAMKAFTDAALQPERSWSFEVDKDGQIRANDVEPGEYQLMISALDPALTGQSINDRRHVVVPRPPVASPREPHDLGEIDL